MKQIFFLLFLFFTTTQLYAQTLYKTIIVASLLRESDAQIQKEQFEAWAKNNPRIMALQKEEGFFFVTRNSGSYIVVALEPLKNAESVSELFKLLKPVYHDAFISNIRSEKLLASYAKGSIAEQLDPTSFVPKPSANAVVTPEAEEPIIPISVEEDTPEEIRASQKHKSAHLNTGVEEQGTTYIVPYLLLGLLALSLLVIYLLVRQRKSDVHVKDIEEKIVTLNSSFSELNSENLEYQDSLTEQEELIEEMTDKLKDPTKSIVGRAGRMLETTLNDKQSIELRNIHDSGQVLFAIVDDLLDFMKIRSNKLEIKTKAFDINELLDIIVRSVIERIEKKDVEVIFDIEKNVPPKMIGDPIRIGQVLTNLLENGIKFTKAGEVKLHVKALAKNEGDIQLMFEVIDTGIGIPVSKLDDIFTPFYQINNNNSAGLGLSISKALIEMMGGEIVVSTELNRGSTFTFVLGLQEVDAGEKRHYRLPDEVYDVRKVLIVDYHDSAASAMKKLLEYFHNEVDVFSQANIEVMAPDLSKYNILFISEKLLTFDLIKQIEPLKAKDAIKVVIVGSMLHKANNTNLIEKLADSHIMKPVNQQTIFNLLVDFYGDDLVVNLPDVPEETVAPVMPRIVIERTQKEDVTKEDFVFFAGAKILVAEDNEINQKVLSSLLKDSNIEVDMAENGKIAVEMAKKSDYDLVLMDMNMPVMDGYEATELLKASSATAALPIVALSGNTMPEEIAKMQACGLDDRLEKPIRVHALYSVFSKYLEYHPLETEVEESALPDKLYVYEEALERCGGDKELYKELVEEFIRLYRDSDTMFKKYIGEKDSAAVKALSLDIKGVSANIGVYALANAAQKINESNLTSASMLHYLDSYKKCLHKTLDALTTKLKTL